MLKWYNMGNIYQLFNAIALSTSLFGAADGSRCLPVPCPGRRWEVLACSSPSLAAPRAMHLSAPASIPPSSLLLVAVGGDRPRKPLPPSQVVLDLGLFSGNSNQSAGVGLLWVLVSFRSICETPPIAVFSTLQTGTFLPDSVLKTN